MPAELHNDGVLEAHLPSQAGKPDFHRADFPVAALAARALFLPRMLITLLAFSLAQDRLGFRERHLECDPGESPRALLARVAPDFDPSSMRVAVDCEYHEWDSPIGEAREIALIPPVSGG